MSIMQLPIPDDDLKITKIALIICLLLFGGTFFVPKPALTMLPGDYVKSGATKFSTTLYKYETIVVFSESQSTKCSNRYGGAVNDFADGLTRAFHSPAEQKLDGMTYYPVGIEAGSLSKGVEVELTCDTTGPIAYYITGIFGETGVMAVRYGLLLAIIVMVYILIRNAIKRRA